MKFLGSSDGENRLVLVGVPYESELVFRRGAKGGPEMIRFFSDSIEDYSIYAGLPIPPFADLGDIDVEGLSAEEMVDKVKNEILNLIRKKKKVLVIGGDHTISLGVIMAYKEIFPDIAVFHFDAHLDRRNDYLGDRLNYATVVKRIEEVVGRDNVYSFGIRSVAKDEEPFVNPNIFEFDVLEPIKQIWEKLDGKPIYVTFDFDVLDPGVFGAVSNPEPCGIDVREALKAIKIVAKACVGADFVEYNPDLDINGSSGVTAAVIIREFLIVTDA